MIKTPELYFPLFGSDFLEAVEGHSDCVGMSYLRALWNYWSVNHCEGLADDDEFLRRICRCDPGDWRSVGPIVFGGFFHLDGGRWHQKRARIEFARTVEILNKKSAAGRLGALKTNRKRYGEPPTPASKGPPPRRQDL